MYLRKFALFALAASLLGAGVAWSQTVFDQVGFSALQSRLGAGMPTGAGVEVMMGEALTGPNQYMPDVSSAQFTGKTLTDRSGSGSVSGHATSVANWFFGNTSGIARGVTAINNYKVAGDLSAGDWFGSTYLNFGAGLPVPEPTQRVQNHSWIATGTFDAALQEIHRRYDYALRRDNVLGVVGVNNGTSTVPPLLGNTYNGIAVGLTSGNSSNGPSTGDVPGRSKPDIVAPLNFTSFATPVVAGAGALLIQTADALGNPSAGRIEVLKSVLLSGATKTEFTSLAQPWNRTNNGSFIEPLDRRFGAGELNIDFSHLILTAGQKNGTDLQLDGPRGWDFPTLNTVAETRTYFINIPDGFSVEFSATANWLRRIDPTGTGSNVFATSDATLSTIELRLFATNPDLTLAALIDSSLSPIDNVQHIYRNDLLPDTTYALELTLAGLPTGQTSEDIGISWIAVVAVPEPQTVLSLSVAGLAVFVFVRRRWLRHQDPAIEADAAE